MSDYAFGVNDLFEMLKYMRPHNSPAEREFMSKYLDTIPDVEKDNFGNRIVRVGDKPTTMWSCHVDTVHCKDGKQKILYHKDCFIVERDSSDGEATEPLGADDCAGVWIMLNMIYAGIDGLYIFHRGEEKGGIGSNHIVMHTPELVKDITHAVAFDKAGDDDIITHQYGGRCCSDEFATHLAATLASPHYTLSPSPDGIFTDTANYTDLIPECTNISVGYYDEHRNIECLDVFYLTALMDSVLQADWSSMPVVRDVRDLATDYGVGNWDHLKVQDTTIYLTKSELWGVYYDHGAETLVQMLHNMDATTDDIDTAVEDIEELYYSASDYFLQ